MAAGRALHPSILREYDIRGVVGDTLTADDARAIGLGFGTVVRRQGGRTVACGLDGRLTSPALESALVEGLAASGIDVVRIGCGPTPMLYFASCALGADAAVMVTGSHNPPEFNGIKMVLGGHSFFGADIRKLGATVAAGDFETGGGGVTAHDVRADYVRRLADDYRDGGALAVAWDAGNGASGEVLQALAARLPGRHVLLNAEIDGTFPAHHPDPTVERNLAQLKEAVLRERLDLGIAFDGDGDRIGVVDSRGRVLWGDQLVLILAGELLAERPGATVIADVKASQVLFDEIARLGGRPLMWRTGHSLIKAKMAETGAPLAGEMSGHIFFGRAYYGYFGFDDALYAAVRLLSILSRSPIGLAEMRDRMPQVVNTPELRFPCAEDRKFRVIEEVKARLEGTPGLAVHDIDGVRVRSADGWWLLRASNTQAVLVARCESASAEGLERLKAELVRQLGASGIAPPSFA